MFLKQMTFAFALGKLLTAYDSVTYCMNMYNLFCPSLESSRERQSRLPLRLPRPLQIELIPVWSRLMTEEVGKHKLGFMKLAQVFKAEHFCDGLIVVVFNGPLER